MMTTARTTSRDPSLPHQIVIGSGRYEGELSVSCNCRKYGFNGAYSPMDHVPVGEDAILKMTNIYNKPSNHFKVEGEPDFDPFINNYKKIRHVEVTE